MRLQIKGSKLYRRIKESLKLKLLISKRRNYKLGGIKPYAHKHSREIKFKLNVQNPKFISQVSSSVNCWEYISELKIDFSYQVL